MSTTHFEKLEPGYYIIEEKIARTKHVVRIMPTIHTEREAEFFGTKREPLSEMSRHYNVVQKLDLELEQRTTAPRTS